MHHTKIPFSLNRNDGRPLVRQLVDGLRQAIVEGYFKPGDAIPSYRDLAPALGVSEIVTKAALRRLSKEGFVTARPRLGTIVRDRSAKRWLGHVVLVAEEGDDNHFIATVAGALRRRLFEAGYLLTRSTVGLKPDGSHDFSSIDAVLARSADLVMVMYHRPEIYAHLAKMKVPFAVFSESAHPPAAAVGAIHFDYNLAMPDFAAVCKAKGVHEVVQIYWHPLMCDAAPALREAGIRVKKVKVPVDESDGRLIGGKRAGRLVIEQMLNGALSPLVTRHSFPVPRSPFPVPPVFFFADDYLASGAFMALYRAGIEAPRDIRFATFANRNIGPDYHCPLSRIEMDPPAAGNAVASAVVEYCRTGVFPAGLVIGPRWIDGETMGV